MFFSNRIASLSCIIAGTLYFTYISTSPTKAWTPPPPREESFRYRKAVTFVPWPTSLKTTHQHGEGVLSLSSLSIVFRSIHTLSYLYFRYHHSLPCFYLLKGLLSSSFKFPGLPLLPRHFVSSFYSVSVTSRTCLYSSHTYLLVSPHALYSIPPNTISIIGPLTDAGNLFKRHVPKIDILRLLRLTSLTLKTLRA